MNRLRFYLFAMLFSTVAFSQSEENYQSTLELVNKAFNQQDASSVYNEFSSELKSKLNEDSFKSMIDSLHKEKSKLESFDLLMEDETGKSYLTSFENGDLLILLKLDSTNKITTFNITEY